MRIQYIIAALVTAYSARPVQADQPPPVSTTDGTVFETHGIHSTGTAAPPRAVEDGAVYELKLRVRRDKIGDYLAEYARWYLPVDQDKDSGRKLLSVLTREHGDQYNLVFLYWYESAYKQNYYCKYRKAFFEHHANAETAASSDRCSFVEYYQQALAEHGEDVPQRDLGKRLAKTVAALRYDCTEPPDERELAAETLHKIDLDFGQHVELDEASWNFDVNLCKVARLRDVKKDKSPITAEQLDAACPWSNRSMLEQAVCELKSGKQECK